MVAEGGGGGGGGPFEMHMMQEYDSLWHNIVFFWFSLEQVTGSGNVYSIFTIIFGISFLPKNTWTV